MMKCEKLNGFALGLVLFAMPLAVPVAHAENATITWAGITVTYSNATKTTSATGDLILKFTDTTTPGTFVLPEETPLWMLLVGGGGAGGTVRPTDYAKGQGGGGGAGGFLEINPQSLEAGLYTVTVGAGGAAAADQTAVKIGEDGHDSVIVAGLSGADVARAFGGGGGGAISAGNGVAGSHGSGGGGSHDGTVGKAGGKGTVGQGSNGGRGSNPSCAGGGGGAAEAGKITTTLTPGAGGAGFKSIILDENVENGGIAYAGGGGGGRSAGTGGMAAGGLGGGGQGGGKEDDRDLDATAGEPNTGGGGGGGGRYSVGGAGGSGIVVVRFLMPAIQPVPRQGLVYTGEAQSALGETPEELGGNWEYVSGEMSATDAGTHSFVVKPTGDLKWKDDGTTNPKIITWSIGTAEVAVPVATDRTYNGSEQVGVAESPLYTLGGTPKATEVKVVDDAVAPYDVTVTLNNVAGREVPNCKWADDDPNDTKQLSWTMHPNVIDPPYRELYYNGAVQDGAVTSMFYTIVGGTTNAQDVGSYTYECALLPGLNPTNVHWSLGDMENKLGSFDIRPLQVPVPAVRKVLLLNAEAKKGQTAVPSADASGICYSEAAHGEAYCRVTGHTATALGAYTVTATLLNTTNFLWATLPPTTVDQHIPWHVQSARTNDLGRIVMEHDRIVTE